MLDLYSSLARPLLFGLLDPEEAHETAIGALRCASACSRLLQLVERWARVEDERLRTTVFGVTFPNPIGLGAGFDKNAVAYRALAALGFGFVEVGTVTALAQPGNPKPRLFRLPADKALINRLGFNNEGAEAIQERLAQTRGMKPTAIPLGINLGKSKVTPLENATRDYLTSFRLLKPFGDYFVVNVSSPNTPDLRKLQEKERLDELLGALQQENRGVVPLLVKIAPDLSLEQIDDVLGLIETHKLAGIIATNTTIRRPFLDAKSAGVANETGGLSGRPLRDFSNQCIRHIAKQTEGKVPVVGVGGVFTAEDAYEKLKLGASLVQSYTGFVYEGPLFARKINQGLLRLMERDGVRQVSEVIGKA